MTTESQDNNKGAFRVVQSTPAPLSADSLREAIKLTVGEAVVFTTDNTLVPNIRVTIEGATDRIMDLFAAALQAERQKIADSLPEKRPGIQEYRDTDGETYHTCKYCGGYDECDCKGFNEAIEAVRAVLTKEEA